MAAFRTVAFRMAAITYIRPLGAPARTEDEVATHPLPSITNPLADGAPPRAENPLSKVDLFKDGLTGSPNAAARRAALAARLGLPTDMTPNALLAALRVITTPAEYRAAVDDL